MSTAAAKVDQIPLPQFIYGTAWKEHETQRLVELALKAGFRGIDTANQRKHYNEAAVGSALAVAFTGGTVRRDELFLQTKFTQLAGQDHRLPYNPAATIDRQVWQSFENSLEHLQTDYVDAYLLHGPSTRAGLAASDWAAWEAMEAIHQTGSARSLGVSNVNLEQLQTLVDRAIVRPRFVQNRCYASQSWDRRVRQFCAAHGIAYQGFSLLTANRSVLAHRRVAEIAARLGCGIPPVIFRFAIDIGILPLTGTSDEGHMIADLRTNEIRLTAEEIATIERLAEPSGGRWGLR